LLVAPRNVEVEPQFGRIPVAWAVSKLVTDCYKARVPVRSRISVLPPR